MGILSASSDGRDIQVGLAAHVLNLSEHIPDDSESMSCVSGFSLNR